MIHNETKTGIVLYHSGTAEATTITIYIIRNRSVYHIVGG